MRIYPRGSQCLTTFPHKCLPWLTCSKPSFKYWNFKSQISEFLWNARYGSTGPFFGQGQKRLEWNWATHLWCLMVPITPCFLRHSNCQLSVSVSYVYTFLICIPAWPMRLWSLQTLIYDYTAFFPSSSLAFFLLKSITYLLLSWNLLNIIEFICLGIFIGCSKMR